MILNFLDRIFFGVPCVNFMGLGWLGVDWGGGGEWMHGGMGERMHDEYMGWERMHDEYITIPAIQTVYRVIGW